jgi:hypothetical protein
MTGAGGAAGPAPDVRHKPEGDVPHDFPEQLSDRQTNSFIENSIEAGIIYMVKFNKLSTLVVQQSRQPCSLHEIPSSNLSTLAIYIYIYIYIYLIYTSIYHDIPV